MVQINTINNGMQQFTTANTKAELSQTEDFAAKLAKASQQQEPKQQAELKKACKEMEAVFLNMLWQGMRRTVPKAGLVGNSYQEEIMRPMLDKELTNSMAKAGGIGLADMLYQQLTYTTSRSSNKGQAQK